MKYLLRVNVRDNISGHVFELVGYRFVQVRHPFKVVGDRFQKQCSFAGKFGHILYVLAEIRTVYAVGYLVVA